MDYSLTNQVLCGIMTIGKNENFQQLVEALERWTVGNPIPIIVKRNPEKNGNNKNVQTKQSERVCVCVCIVKKIDHTSSDCKNVKTVIEHRKVIGDKKFCFNCT